MANIFVLPFAKTVWLSVISLLFFTAAILILQFRLVEKLEQALTVRFLEVFTFLTGAACQQGKIIKMYAHKKKSGKNGGEIFQQLKKNLERKVEKIFKHFK